MKDKILFINTGDMRRDALSIKEGQGTKIGSIAKMLIDCCDYIDQLRTEWYQEAVYLDEQIDEWRKKVVDLRAENGKLKKENERRRNLLEDVINELQLSDMLIEKHGSLGTPPAELVRLVLEGKDRQIKMLKQGMTEIG